MITKLTYNNVDDTAFTHDLHSFSSSPTNYESKILLPPPTDNLSQTRMQTCNFQLFTLTFLQFLLSPTNKQKL